MNKIFLLLLVLLVIPVSTATAFNETQICENTWNTNFTLSEDKTIKAFFESLNSNATEGYEGWYLYGYCSGLNMKQGALDAAKYLGTD